MRRLASTAIVLIAPLLATLAAAQVVSAQASDESRASDRSPTPSPATVATATPFPVSADPASIQPGTYRIPSSAWSVADLTVTFPEG